MTRMPLSSLRLAHLSMLFMVAELVMPTGAQTSQLFQWGFANPALSTSLQTCSPLPIVVKSSNPIKNDTHGTPPYYMIAFVLGGTPVTTLIGSDENNLSWTVTQPVGSQLVLSVVDANGSAGGIPPRVSTVIAGPTTQCVATPSTTPEFKVISNVTGDLQTCQPWGFTVIGGVPPYTLTLAAPNSPTVTNATLGYGDNNFTYINRAAPGGQLLGAISDINGRWATGTTMVSTKARIIPVQGKSAQAASLPPPPISPIPPIPPPQPATRDRVRNDATRS
ncbi:hypothetical protein B0H34DRAFT_113424 [Crassisporium funariophilum]|nr:hypothetical protein B0H34DRAFT_113424 [Crassisporium funariophilum]